MQIECIVPSRSRIGEGAVLNDRASALCWVDIPAGLIHHFDRSAGKNTSVNFGEPVGFLAVRAKGGLVVAAKSGAPKVFFYTRTVPGRPDGGTVDADGCYWQAGIDGWQLYRITPAGKVDLTVEMPIERPSNAMFGGPGPDTLYVTSLGIGLTEGRPQPEAGSLFAVTELGITGVPQPHFVG